MKLIESAVKDAGAEIITLAVRRANTSEEENILDFIPDGVTLLPNTSEQEMPMKQSVSPALQGLLDAGTL